MLEHWTHDSTLSLPGEKLGLEDFFPAHFTLSWQEGLCEYLQTSPNFHLSSQFSQPEVLLVSTKIQARQKQVPGRSPEKSEYWTYSSVLFFPLQGELVFSPNCIVPRGEGDYDDKVSPIFLLARMWLVSCSPYS